MIERIFAALGLLAVSLACGTTTAGSFTALPQQDSDAWVRCHPELHCEKDHEGNAQATQDCILAERRKYEDFPSWDVRRSWLLSNGCPASVVDGN